ncbi:hypothetical protein Tco_0250319 [Tanacetum coccineum]
MTWRWPECWPEKMAVAGGDRVAGGGEGGERGERIIKLDDGVAASFQRIQIHKPHAHTQAFKVNHSTSRSFILNFPTIKEPQSQIKNHLLRKIVRLMIIYVKQECNKYEHVGQEHKMIENVKSR